MKKILFLVLITISLGGAFYACQESFLDRPPLGGLDETTLANSKGVEAVLIGAYSLLDGWAQGWGSGDAWHASASNWVFGGICGGDAHKGSDNGDQNAVNPIARYEGLPSNAYFRGKWRVLYDGVARSNSVLKLLVKATDISAARAKQIEGEARFLRGHYHFEAKKCFNNIPYVDDKATDFNVPNDRDVWPDIVNDLKFAYDNLPETQAEVGRVNKWTAGALLAKAYMFQRKFADAKPLLEAIIANGKTSKGEKYGLNAKYNDNFLIATKNNKESVFAVQSSVNDGEGAGENGNYGDVLNFPYQGGPGTCCGFYQPSQELVNSFRTDANGLPLLDGSHNIGANQIKNDQGVDSKDPFTPDAGRIDPRLDHTVGRRGIPYLDWGLYPGEDWIRDQSYGGPYAPIKHVYKKSEQGSGSTASGWALGASANNVNLIRFAHILLWAAECEVEVGSLEAARAYVNQVRARAANPADFVLNNGAPAANYVVDTYKTPWTDKTLARKAVQFEHKIEFGMEGHRFFDLVRWGIAKDALTAYLAYESKLRVAALGGASFTAGKSEYFPIPQQEIVASTVNGQATLKQNPGY